MTPMSETDLRKVAFHVRWEFDMLGLAAEKVGVLRPNTTTRAWGTTTITATAVGTLSVQAQQHKTVDSLIFEALLVHLRNLLQFLFANRLKQKDDPLRVLPGDVLACDYVGPAWRPTRPPWLTEYREGCNRLLAHLSIERPRYIENRTIEWPGLPDKIEHIKGVYVAFLRSLTLDRQAWFHDGP